MGMYGSKLSTPIIGWLLNIDLNLWSAINFDHPNDRFRMFQVYILNSGLQVFCQLAMLCSWASRKVWSLGNRSTRSDARYGAGAGCQKTMKIGRFCCEKLRFNMI